MVKIIEKSVGLPKYSYHDMPDRTLSGVKKEVARGSVIAAVYFQTSFGVPVEYFNDWWVGLGSLESQLLWYMNFRNGHSKLFRAGLKSVL